MFNFILFGTGWRAQFFMRIASTLSSQFSIPMVYTHSEERIPEVEKMGFAATTDKEKALAVPHDAVVVASGPKGLVSLLQELEARGEKIISETSFLALTEEEREICSHIAGFAMEQYRYTPTFQSAFALMDRIGKVNELRLSMLHNHHSAAIMRKTFPTYTEGYEMERVDFPSHIVKTGSRAGRVTTGEMQDYTRKIRILKGKDWFFLHDFATNQYHTHLISSTFEFRGERGVIDNKGISFVGEDGTVISDVFHRHFDGDTTNGVLSLSHITILGEVVYRNPFYGAVLNDDEVAIATMLKDIAEGKPCYTIKEAVEDAKLGKLF